jgi:tetratricopeptide (TPR) repeat protein
MPSHIYLRVGRYADAARSNELAVLADEDYITQCRIQGFYPISYYPHNIHFLWFAETMRGRSRSAIEAARKVASKLGPEILQEAPAMQFFAAVPFAALVRFGRWEEILDEPRPPYEGPLVMGMWHFARGMAFGAKRQFDEAAVEIDRLREIATDPEVSKMTLWSVNTVGRVLLIGLAVLEGDLAARTGDYERSIMLLDKAARLEDALVYTEPPDWSIPVRHILGAVLLEAGRPSEAETVYWEDLRRNPENGWSLFGLGQALRAQDKDEKAGAIEQRFLRAWADADITLSATRF